MTLLNIIIYQLTQYSSSIQSPECQKISIRTVINRVVWETDLPPQFDNTEAHSSDQSYTLLLAMGTQSIPEVLTGLEKEEEITSQMLKAVNDQSL